MLTVSIHTTEKLGPSRNSRMALNFPVTPIFRNISSKGSCQFLEILAGTFSVSLDFRPEISEILTEWKALHVSAKKPAKRSLDHLPWVSMHSGKGK